MAQSKNARKDKNYDVPLCKFCKNPVEVVTIMPGRKKRRICCEKAKAEKS